MAESAGSIRAIKRRTPRALLINRIVVYCGNYSSTSEHGDNARVLFFVFFVFFLFFFLIFFVFVFVFVRCSLIRCSFLSFSYIPYFLIAQHKSPPSTSRQSSQLYLIVFWTLSVLDFRGNLVNQLEL